MGLFDFLKKSPEEPKQRITAPNEPPIPASEKKYYQPAGYYTDTVPIAGVSMDGKYGRRKVVTFEERKKTSIPSKNGLYVAEILLLEYCSYGTYPRPKTGYPGFWWFEYGIKNVGAKLQNLEKRGFIRKNSPRDSVSKLTVPQLKQILSDMNLSTSGKKADLVQRVLGNVPDAALSKYVTETKYVLTELGQRELAENSYVPYMHKHPEKTIDLDLFGPIFNVWEVNRRLARESDWKKIVAKMEKERKDYFNRK